MFFWISKENKFCLFFCLSFVLYFSRNIYTLRKSSFFLMHKKNTIKDQIIIIDWWETFDSDSEALQWLINCDWDLMSPLPSWKKWLSDGLANIALVIRPNMPNTMNAKYEEWKIWFEKYFPHITDTHTKKHLTTYEHIEERRERASELGKLILIGHSLGTIFLLKYLSESGFPRGIDALHLVSPVFDNDEHHSVGSFAFSPAWLPHLHKAIPRIHIWASTDDTVVPYEHAVRYHISILGSTLHTFHDRGHFIGESHFVELFEELLKELKA